jgi:hypothetical protein
MFRAWLPGSNGGAPAGRAPPLPALEPGLQLGAAPAWGGGRGRPRPPLATPLVAPRHRPPPAPARLATVLLRRAPGEVPELYLGLLYPTEDYRVYG